ncbi:TMEM165/GDT1 family protein [Rhodococcus triatomae]|uniref:GDT1 family protein n=1 Tax=Rhodococcus triatomae TaxID=300028 RepID=A0A1G8HTC6_9NOCA|nr:TMEM165/GDT1 family protein [Rhodococcus triatomae]QNG20873.1 TMEM165/GDT1 family protein [Rhodococcus triatomae]QNG23212.1 TMEM165/GDT1 family protein [Rhodococcus triatomae]SDI09908.1 Putative Ca2+/H+ antiporter, TMEM165/GDT1 family [Rhodococcus triatomae]
MLAALAVSFAVIFVAELGDKSQLMAMTFALRYRWWVVISAIAAATTGVHLLSVGLGHVLGVALPTTLIAIVGGVAFLVFGLWTLRGDSLSEAETVRAGRVTRSAFMAVTAAFVLAELGDKTMLATVTLATDHDPIGVWIGSTVGMVAADALAIVLGAVLGKHLPEDAIRLGASVLFFVFGVWLLLDALLPGTPAGLVGAAITLVTGTAAATWWSRTRRRAPDAADEQPEPADVLR